MKRVQDHSSNGDRVALAGGIGMKCFKAYRLYCFLIIASMGLSAKLCIYFAHVCSIDECVVSVEGSASTMVAADAVEYVHAQWPKSSLFFDQLCAQTMSKFDWIVSIDVALLPYRKAMIELVAYEPLYRINNDYVVTVTGKLLPKNNFDSLLVSALGHINIVFSNNEPVLSDACRQFILAIPSSLLDTYQCVWESDTRVRLYDKQQTHFVIVCHPLMMPNEKMIQHCNALKGELVERCVFELPRAKTWVADIRFEDQIVVSQEKGGNRYGANI